MVAEHLPFIQRQQPDRTRRSLTFVGDFFECCCDIAIEHQIHNLVDNEEGVYTALSTQQHYLLSELPAHSPASHADTKNWYSPIMMERFDRVVVMSWRENNIKTEEQGGEEEVEDGNSKSDVREC
ncbi:hypothetical protein J6590_079855 [Homalodisca vitripennis]|nr:hypothetical protein J6590_079855 [Homalodisca vitripennis]